MGRHKRRRLTCIQNLNGRSDKSSSKRRKTTGNSDLEVCTFLFASNRIFTLEIQTRDLESTGMAPRSHPQAMEKMQSVTVSVPMHHGKYRGHRVLPNDIMEELGKKGII